MILEVINGNIRYMKNFVIITIELGRLNSPFTEFNLEVTNLFNKMEKILIESLIKML